MLSLKHLLPVPVSWDYFLFSNNVGGSSKIISNDIKM
jgi:hypothetical protein